MKPSARLLARIVVDERAVPWSTPETIMVPAANGKRRAVHKKDKRLIAWQDTVRAACRRAYDGEPFGGPVRLEIGFVRGTDDESLWGEPWWNASPGTGHPDLVNVFKSTEDALKTYTESKGKGCDRVVVFTIPGVIRDDAQVCDVSASKVYGRGDSCDIRVYALEA